MGEDFLQLDRGDLLGFVAESLVRIDVALYHKAVVHQVQGLLGNRGNQLRLAAHVARVAEHLDVREPSFHLDRDVPQRNVAVDLVAVRAEAAVDKYYLSDSGIQETLQGTSPELDIGIDRILDQKSLRSLVQIFDGVCQSLDRKRVCGSAGTYPENVHPGLQSLVKMFGSRNLAADFQPCFFFDVT